MNCFRNCCKIILKGTLEHVAIRKEQVWKTRISARLARPHFAVNLRFHHLSFVQLLLDALCSENGDWSEISFGWYKSTFNGFINNLEIPTAWRRPFSHHAVWESVGRSLQNNGPRSTTVLLVPFQRFNVVISRNLWFGNWRPDIVGSITASKWTSPPGEELIVKQRCYCCSANTWWWMHQKQTESTLEQVH